MNFKWSDGAKMTLEPGQVWSNKGVNDDKDII